MKAELKSIKAEQWTEIASRVGEGYGYEDVAVDVAVFRDFKVSWERSYKTIAFHFPDYLENASDVAIENLCDCIFSKILGRGDVKYNDEFKNFALGPDFVKKNRKTYISRTRDAKSDDGLKAKLKEFTKDKSIAIYRTTAHQSYASPLFKTIFIAEGTDLDEDIPAQLYKIDEGRAKFE